MRFAYLVIYKGTSEDPNAFLRYYIDVHLPLVWTFPKIRAVQVERGVDSGDIFMVARFLFDTLEDLRAAITSEQRERARADSREFILPKFKGTVHHQAVEILDIPRE